LEWRKQRSVVSAEEKTQRPCSERGGPPACTQKKAKKKKRREGIREKEQPLLAE